MASGEEVASEWEDTDASSEDGGSDDNEAIGGGFDEASRRILFPPATVFFLFFLSSFPLSFSLVSTPLTTRPHQFSVRIGD